MLTDGINSLFLMRLLNKHMQVDKITPILLRAALAAIFMGGVVLLARTYFPLFVTILIGAAVYGALARALGLIDDATLIRMRSWMGRRLLRRNG